MRVRALLVIVAIGLTLLVLQAEGSNRRTPVVEAVERAAPAVVNIYTEKIVERRLSPFGGWRDPFFDEFFRDFFEQRVQRYKTTSLGSGVIIRADGYVLTNQHVVQRASHVKIKLLDDRELDAEIVGTDSDSDLAVLKVEDDRDLPYIAMADSSDLMIGETVIAIGNPFGLSNTVTTGVVSALGRSLQTEQQTYYDFIQTDASINPGNSGGPLLNMDGELIGINAAIYQKAQGIGFAIPISRARRIVEDLISYGEVHVPWVGLLVQPITPHLARHFGVGPGKGVIVSAIEADSPATKVGIQRGDVITTLAGARVGSTEEYEQRLRNQPENASIALTLWREGGELQLSVQARPFPPERADALAWRAIGVKVAPGQRGMAIVAIRPQSPAAVVGAQAGDEIIALGGRKVDTPERFRRRIADARSSQSILLTIQRGRYLHHVPLRLDLQ
jgi:Do/DeqQ family serine protease